MWNKDCQTGVKNGNQTAKNGKLLTKHLWERVCVLACSHASSTVSRLWFISGRAHDWWWPDGICCKSECKVWTLLVQSQTHILVNTIYYWPYTAFLSLQNTHCFTKKPRNVQVVSICCLLRNSSYMFSYNCQRHWQQKVETSEVV